MCIEHGFVVNKTHSSIKKTMHKKFDLKMSCYIWVLFNGIAYRCVSFFLLRRYITVHVFCKICRKYSSNSHWLRLVSVLVGFLFDMQISLILKIQSISKAKCHAVWKKENALIHIYWIERYQNVWHDNLHCVLPGMNLVHLGDLEYG